jgi:hypothetical protein
MQNLELGFIEVDEIWGFIGKKQTQVTRADALHVERVRTVKTGKPDKWRKIEPREHEIV